VEAAAQQVLAAALRHRKIAGRPAASTELTKRYVDEGFLFFQAPSDLAFFEAGAQQFLGAHGIQPARRQRTLY
jgi:2-keto-3-deoxy-L-rhamnonate aldolase RhmA